MSFLFWGIEFSSHWIIQLLWLSITAFYQKQKNQQTLKSVERINTTGISGIIFLKHSGQTLYLVSKLWALVLFINRHSIDQQFYHFRKNNSSSEYTKKCQWNILRQMLKLRVAHYEPACINGHPFTTASLIYHTELWYNLHNMNFFLFLIIELIC